MTNELALRYGCNLNLNQKPARLFMKKGELPIEVLNGRPGYINLLNALNSCQLVKELKVTYIAQPGGSVRDDHVIDTCNKYNMATTFTGIRLFHH